MIGILAFNSAFICEICGQRLAFSISPVTGDWPPSALVRLC
jgi:hypothetical protein